MSSQPTLVFIAPLWIPELEELLNATKASFQVKVLTQKQTIFFNDPFIEILQCFESYFPLEIAKLVPWLLQLSSPQFHVLLPENPTHRQLAGVGTLATIVKALPQSTLTHSPWSQKSWGFSLWLKMFQNLFDSTLLSTGKRFLSLPRPQMGEDPLRTLSDKSLDLHSQVWVFPSHSLIENESHPLLRSLLSSPENQLEFWNWETLPIRHKNKARHHFSAVWKQFSFHSPRTQLEEWRFIKFLVLIDTKSLLFSETDLLDLVLIHRIQLIMDDSYRRQLKGPWKDGDNFWLWHPAQFENENRPWNNSYKTLPFSSQREMISFQDQISNQVLRSFTQRSWNL